VTLECVCVCMVCVCVFMVGVCVCVWCVCMCVWCVCVCMVGVCVCVVCVVCVCMVGVCVCVCVCLPEHNKLRYFKQIQEYQEIQPRPNILGGIGTIIQPVPMTSFLYCHTVNF